MEPSLAPPPIPPYKTLWSSHGESKGVGCHYHVASGFNAVLVRFLSYFSDQRIQWIMILIPSRPFRRATSGFHFKSRRESWEGPQLPPLLNHSCILRIDFTSLVARLFFPLSMSFLMILSK